MKAKATTPDKHTGRDSAPEASKHEWRGGGVEEPAASAGPLSETPEAAATRAEGNAPVEASAEAKRAHPSAGDNEAPPSRRHSGQHPSDPADEEVIDELKRQAAIEEHAAARGGKLIRGPI